MMVAQFLSNTDAFVWSIDKDPDFDLAFHVRRVDAPGAATIDTLLEMARIAAMADFGRDRPLWEVTLIDGLDDGVPHCSASCTIR